MDFKNNFYRYYEMSLIFSSFTFFLSFNDHKNYRY